MTVDNEFARENYQGALTEYEMPADEASILDAAKRCKKLVTKRALMSAGLNLLPIPGASVAVDVSLMLEILNSINHEFGLTPNQIRHLTPDSRLRLFQMITATGSSFAGKWITKPLVMAVLQKLSIRLTAAQAAKLVPALGLAASAGISFAALKWVGDQHIKDCVNIAKRFNEQGFARAETRRDQTSQRA